MNIRLAISGKERVRVVAMIAGAQDRIALNELASRENWRLQIVGNGVAALEELKRHPAVLLCEGDWRSTLDALRADAPRSRMILAVAATDDKLWLEVLERGGSDVVTRPFHARRLIDSVTLAWREVTK